MIEQDLKELLQKKREIENQIKTLKNADYRRVGDAKIDKIHYSTNKPDRYYVAVKVYLLDSNKWVWRMVASSEFKQEAIDRIPAIIQDLGGLYDVMTKESY